MRDLKYRTMAYGLLLLTAIQILIGQKNSQLINLSFILFLSFTALLQLKWYVVQQKRGQLSLLLLISSIWLILLSQNRNLLLFLAMLLVFEWLNLYPNMRGLLAVSLLYLIHWAVLLYQQIPIDFVQEGVLVGMVSIAYHIHRQAIELKQLQDTQYLWLSEKRELSRNSEELMRRLGTMRELYTLKERNRISREIHDSVGHVLSTVVIQLGAISKLTETSNPNASAMSGNLRDYTAKGLQTVRQVVSDLRPDNYESQQTFMMLDELINEVEGQTGLRIIFHVNDAKWQLSERQGLLIYRAVQEFISNSIRHGQASEVQLTLHYNIDNLIMTLQDNGVGTVEIVPHVGLMGVEERVHEQGGYIQFTTSLGQGFRTRIILNKEVAN